MEESLARTPLHALHLAQGAKMVPFAGYEMPVQYPPGIMAEHFHTRAKAGLFDVSHMGQVRIPSAAAAAFEKLVPGDIVGLGPMRQRYTLLLDETGGILDDLMVTNAGDHLFVVVNAARKHADIAHLQKTLDAELLEDRALLALQGPAAAAVMGRLAPELLSLRFMGAGQCRLAGIPCFATRSGYTGEDGFEISVPADAAEKVATLLLDQPEVMPIGLGARDSLRLEAGLCLYGHDIDETTTPIEADLGWTIAKRRREEASFPGAEIILRQLAEGPPRRRVGIQPEGRAPAREGAEILSGGKKIGSITSGGYGPTVGTPIAMGYVATAAARAGAALELMVRGTPRPARVAPLPFVPHRYYRG
ncbi:MAG: glycine cleavage system aminomethyltransferase GcvT [Rhodospirillales bacterium]|nr:glycine cleavage system aminomethyltransferase GcvT [Rhodospirillales bacterium]